MSFRSLIFVFFLCFSSFIAGWLSAIYAVPKNATGVVTETVTGAVSNSRLEDSKKPDLMSGTKDLAPNKPATNNLAPQNIKTPSALSFKKVRDSLLFLFDPYKVNSFKPPAVTKQPEQSFKSKTALNLQKQSPQAKKQKPLTFNNSFESSSLSFPASVDNQKDLLKPTELQIIQAEYDKKNREQLLKIKGQQKLFTSTGQFSFLVNVFSKPKEALQYNQTIKKQYPTWSFFLKAYSDHVRIYLGPFASKQKALEFKNKLPQPPPFDMNFLEEMPL